MPLLCKPVQAAGDQRVSAAYTLSLPSWNFTTPSLVA